MDAPDFFDKRPAIEATLQRLGLYVEHMAPMTVPDPMGEREALGVTVTIGDVAFKPRTVDPEAAKFDAEFAALAIRMQDQEYDDERARIAAAIAEGRDPFGDDDAD